MQKRIFGVVIILIFIAIGSFFVFQRQSHRETPEVLPKIKIASLPVVQGLPVYMALEKGYFKEAGLDVELVNFEAPNQIVDALLQGQVDLSSPSGAMGIIGIADFKNPGKLKVYAGAGGTDLIQNDAILVKNDSPLIKIEDLKGKKLGILAGSIQWRTIARDILAKNGLNLDTDVTLVDLAVGLQAQALASGQVDALLAIEPIPTIVKQKGIGKEMVDHITTRYISSPFYGGAGIVRESFLNENPELADKVLAVIGRTIVEINQQPDSTRQYLKGYTPLEDSLIAEVPISNFKMYNDFTMQDIEAVEKFYSIFTTHKVVDGTLNFKRLIHTN